MQTVSLFNAKTHLSGLIEQIASGAETEITISRHGQPVARLVPYPKPTSPSASVSQPACSKCQTTSMRIMQTSLI